MQIINHLLYHDDGTPYPFEESPNSGGTLRHEYLVMHFTAGRTAKSAVRWLTQAQAKASAHLVIGRDGSITQLVPFNVKAWHAGRSSWEGRTGLNKYSIGIELVNAGRLKRQGGEWKSWFNQVYDDVDVLEATHKHESSSSGWHVYTEEQLEAAMDVASLLVDEYGLQDVIGHDDIAPQRKNDPGPAFPMDSFRARVMGREDLEEFYETAGRLNIRTGPGTQYEKLPESPLPAHTPVDILDTSNNWKLVTVLETINDNMDIEGWVHGRYLQRQS
ncbi:negative regulator of beta-lactamase expression [Leptolyngbya sp. PCC 7375]|nr:negative regulator of beta-lactamase expression [Leptolyngbya sp. PCC 7375]